MMNFQAPSNLESYAFQIQERINCVDSLLKIEHEVCCNEGVALYSLIGEQLHKLKVIITKMQLIIEDERRNFVKSQEKLSNLKLLHKKVDDMIIFSLQNSSKDDSTHASSILTSKENTHGAETVKPTGMLPVPIRSEKENAPERVKSTRKMGVPSLNGISQEDFEKVPKYMKGRLGLEQLNLGITDVNLILSKKYELFNRRRKDLSLKQEKLRSVYLEQGKDLKGSCYSIFFVDDDIQRYSSTLKLQRKTRDCIFLILRHLGRMKEMHKGKLNRYCILSA